MKWKWSVWAAVFLVAACNLAKVDPATTGAAHVIFDEIHHGDDAALDAQMGPDLKTPEARSGLAKVRAFIPQEDPKARIVIGLNTFFGAMRSETINEEYDYGDRKALVQTVLVWADDAKKPQLEGFSFRIATLKELQKNNLASGGKTPWQYLFFALVVLSPLSMVVALVKVIRTKGLKLKWLWGILAFAGVFSLQMNWATGQLATNWLTVQLLGAGVVRGASQFSAWVLTMTVPVGALLILTGAIARAPAQAAAGEAAPTAN